MVCQEITKELSLCFCKYICTICLS